MLTRRGLLHTPRRTRPLTTTCALGAVLLVSGCGDDGPTPESPGITTPTGASTVLEEPQPTSPSTTPSDTTGTSAGGAGDTGGGSSNSEVTPNSTPSQNG